MENGLGYVKKNAIAGHSFAGWSDLDLLCRVAATKQASTLRSDIAVIAREALMRLDQEIICGAGSVQWREPTTAETDELLEKRQGGVDSMT
ncbi:MULTISPECIES: phosphoribosyl-dephospho-CoA transferase MdcG domain-containing protein [Bradyrhizobium]|uniref:phosphoribosyl-dephospho-CoA transferase MdcG domain-containing protein n=1 Tax=Bradyrhizobium centrosematis TaxID=1300039 RepID=UPI0035B66186|nr:hypothetical protein [Bradyrhizobium centrosematis]MCS3777985.1 hypothetical protein [Bradyrhizobium centrosematis]